MVSCFGFFKLFPFGQAAVNTNTATYHPQIPVQDRRYAVLVGLRPGVYTTAVEALEQTEGIPGGYKQMFATVEEAHEAFEQAKAAGAVRQANRLGARIQITKDNLEEVEGLDPTTLPPVSFYYVVLRGKRVGIFAFDASSFASGISGGHCVRYETFQECYDTFYKSLKSGSVIKDTFEWELVIPSSYFTFSINELDGSRAKKVGPDGLTKDQHYYQKHSEKLKQQQKLYPKRASRTSYLLKSRSSPLTEQKTNDADDKSVPLKLRPLSNSSPSTVLCQCSLRPIQSTKIYCDMGTQTDLVSLPNSSFKSCEIEIPSDLLPAESSPTGAESPLAPVAKSPPVPATKSSLTPESPPKLAELSSKKSASIWDEDLWLGDHVHPDVWCRNLGLNAEALRGNLNDSRPQWTPISPILPVLQRDDLDYLNWLAKLRFQIHRWSSTWGGVLLWDDSLDMFYLHALKTGEPTMRQLVKGFWKKSYKGRAFLDELSLWCYQGIPEDGAAILVIFHEIIDLIKVLLYGIARIEVPDIKEEGWVQSFLTGISVDEDVLMEESLDDSSLGFELKVIMVYLINFKIASRRNKIFLILTEGQALSYLICDTTVKKPVYFYCKGFFSKIVIPGKDV
ncbi:hypothetical protein CPB83DRAFT_840405 [Crepidotus variabilis]|uniref:Ribonuclease H1 N-terminal domain-containing protein n=1 Tax=Crepidotus variabilis TaxID=179855 RepID=A0A9P6E4T3_9AGAR|nr:hypothetical protein CPB83DRAFT_840405 [Crepidotus variabilis]